jgi:citrate lyase subunit beta / citryl-CoA lyase
MTSHLIRTALYVPALNRKAAAKAEGLGADAVIFDLEDSVAPDQKLEARSALTELPPAGGALRIIRVNAAGTEWQEADIAAGVALQPHALLVPKVGSQEDVWVFRRQIALLKPQKPVAIWAMIETPLGILNAAEISEALGPDGVIVMGLNDLAKETGMQQVQGRQPMLAALTMTVLAARAYGVGILDGVYNSIADEKGFELECLQGKIFGFDGKSVVHPRQIGPANSIFGPTDVEIEESKIIVLAFSQAENSTKGVIALGGRMVERMHLDMALIVLEKAQKIADRFGSSGV